MRPARPSIAKQVQFPMRYRGLSVDGKRKGATAPAALAIAMTPPVATAVEVAPVTVAVRRARLKDEDEEDQFLAQLSTEELSHSQRDDRRVRTSDEEDSYVSPWVVLDRSEKEVTDHDERGTCRISQGKGQFDGPREVTVVGK